MRGPEASGRWQVPLIVADGRRGEEPGFLRGDKPERGPVEIAIATRDTRDQPVPDHADRRHRGARLLRLRERQTHILEHEGQDKSGRVDLPAILSP